MTVATEHGRRRLDYDRLVYAIGSATDMAGVPGADEHAHSLNGPQAAARFAARLDELGPDDVVVVGGNGLTGIEAATEVAESHPHLRVVLLGLAEPGSMMGPKARAYLDRALDRLGVEVRSGVLITKVLPDGVEQPVSLGRKDAVIQFTKRDDTPRRLWIKGSRAVVYKAFVTASPPATYRIARRWTFPVALLSARGGRTTRRGPSETVPVTARRWR